MKKTVFKYFKNRILVMLSFMVVSFVIFFSNNEVIKANQGYQNAYLCCFIDDTSNSYRTQVIYTGTTTEFSNVSHLFINGSLNTDYNTPNDSSSGYATRGRVPLYNKTWLRHDNNTAVDYGSERVFTTLTLNDSDKGYFNLTLAKADGSGEVNKVYAEENLDTAIDGGKYSCSPCSFPYPTRNAKSSDINRAYEVQDAIADDFMNALLFVNDGKSFKSVDQLVQTAYYVCTSDDLVSITNLNGNKFTLKWQNVNIEKTNNTKINPLVTDPTGYTYGVFITKTGGDASVEDKEDFQQFFTYGVKKGYKDCYDDELTEAGTKNHLDKSTAKCDTIFITWEHLYTNAGVLYENGITYANQGDIFKLSDMEDKVVEMTRNLLGGLRSMLQLYTMEDCIFNSGVRGSSAFVYGIYNESWTHNVNYMIIIFTSIAISLIAFSVVKLVIQKQISIISPAMRVQLIEGIKDILMSVMFIAFAYLLFRFVFLLNFKFVDMFKTMVNGRKLSDSAGYSTLAAILYQFAYFVITVYVNFVYILRGFAVPFFMMISPLCFYAFSLGKGGQKITATWLKEFIGYVFIQSVHALVYGFCIISSNGLRGIESIILCASIIPLTSAVRNVFGLGGGLLDTASSLTTGAVLGGVGVASAGANLVGNVAGGFADTVGNIVGSDRAKAIGGTLGKAGRFTGNVVGNSVSALGGAGLSAGLGATDNTALTQGMNMSRSGISGIAGDLNSAVDTANSFISSHGDDIKGGLAMAGAGIASGVANARTFSGAEGMSSIIDNRVSNSSALNRDIGPNGSMVGSKEWGKNDYINTARRRAYSRGVSLFTQQANASKVASYRAGQLMSGGSITSLKQNSNGTVSGVFTPLSSKEFCSKYNFSEAVGEKKYEEYSNSLKSFVDDKEAQRSLGISMTKSNDGNYNIDFNKNHILSQGVLSSISDTDNGFNAKFRCLTMDEFFQKNGGDLTYLSVGQLSKDYNNYRNNWNNETKVLFGGDNRGDRGYSCQGSFARKGFVNADEKDNSIITMKF